MKRYSRMRQDPYWFTAKRAGTDAYGEAIKIGDRCLYYPASKLAVAPGERADASWRQFLSEVGDEEGIPYAC